MHYYTHNCGEFASLTAGLDLEGVGIVIRLLDRMATTEKPIKTQWVSLGFPENTQSKVLAILAGLFEETPEGWVFPSMMEAVEVYQRNLVKNRENGKKGGRPRKTQENPVGSSGLSEGTQENPVGSQPITNNQEPIDIGGAKAPCALSRPEAAKGAPAPAPPADESIFSEAEEAKAAETAETEEAEASDTTEAEEPKAAPSKPKLAYPRCEIQKVVDLYHQNCPGLRRVTALNAARRSAISARWKDFCREDHYTETAQVLDAFDWYFKRVAASPFLMGQTNPGYGRERPFVAHFDWLMKSSNFLKVCEGAYNAA